MTTVEQKLIVVLGTHQLNLVTQAHALEQAQDEIKQLKEQLNKPTKKTKKST